MFYNLLLQAAPAAAQKNSSFMSIALMVGMVVVMYFFMIRPQAKRAKEQKKFGEGINSGENIITTAGIHGRIQSINADGTIKLEISRNTFITIERSAVSMEMTQAMRKRDAATPAPKELA